MAIIFYLHQGLYTLLIHPQDKESDASNATRSLTGVTRMLLFKGTDDMKNLVRERPSATTVASNSMK
jgi:hypothetical protein